MSPEHGEISSQKMSGLRRHSHSGSIPVAADFQSCELPDYNMKRKEMLHEMQH